MTPVHKVYCWHLYTRSNVENKAINCCDSTQYHCWSVPRVLMKAEKMKFAWSDSCCTDFKQDFFVFHLH